MSTKYSDMTEEQKERYKAYHREYSRKNQAKRQIQRKQRGRKKKAKLLDLGGGCCVHCGLQYDRKNGAVFDFHHRNPEEKEFSLNQTDIDNNSWERVLTELQKCDIVCSNCHRMIHNDEF